MPYISKWEDFIQSELQKGAFKDKLELKNYYKKSFEQNKKVVEDLIKDELESILRGNIFIRIYEEYISIHYSGINLPNKIFVMPCNYYGNQVNHEFIYGTPDEVIPYIIYFTLQKYSVKFAQLGLYYIPPKNQNRRNYRYDKIIVKETLEDCYKELFSSVITAWPHLDKSKNDLDRTKELEELLSFHIAHSAFRDSPDMRELRFEEFLKNAIELDFTNRIKIKTP